MRRLIGKPQKQLMLLSIIKYMTKKECIAALSQLTDIWYDYENSILTDLQLKAKLNDLIEEINWGLMKEGV